MTDEGPIADETLIAEEPVWRGSIARGLRLAVIVSGVIALLAGLAILIWPVKSAVVVTVLIALYAIVAGVANLALALFARELGGWFRAAVAVLGALYLVAGVVAFANLDAAAVALATVFALFLGIAWIVDGVFALTTLGVDRHAYSPVRRSRGWTIAFGLLSVVAGTLVILAPVWAALWVWLFVGAALLVFGLIQIVRAAALER
ncbi:HdeD family acid-resistance protein [Microbacterium sediminis]|uniref:HdeD family acid-resistance protein n=1 Tax=Microbacterium sediminis TaxID=904291 RepID=UPI0009FD7DE6|nr:DUF308 domain-containing protein [Microbacterium sediminis]QBR73249.1 hypothetical protein E3O41_01540 [Microbacterium sediminis]